MSVRLVRYGGEGRPAWGVVAGESVVPLPATYNTTADVLGDGVELARTLAADPAAERVPLSALRLLHPTPGARIICQGANYRSHMAESGIDPDRAFNILFTKSTAALTGPDDDIVRPSHVRLLDYEVELGIVIGKPVDGPATVTDANLPDYIGAFVLANDVSARDVQLPQGQWYKGKSYRTFCPVGPFLVVPDPGEAGRWRELRLTLSVNGSVRQDSLAADMVFGPAATLSELSGLEQLAVGDLVLTGTPGGCALQPPPALVQRIAGLLPDATRWGLFLKGQARSGAYLKPGDQVVASIRTDDGALDLGTQHNTVRLPPRRLSRQASSPGGRQMMTHSRIDVHQHLVPGQLTVPVLIVGGGGAGLTTSMLLSTMGVDCLLVNAGPGTSILPKAHVLNQRTMEILTDLAVADDIYAAGTPPHHMAYTAWYAGFAGDGPDWGRQIAKLESWGAGGQNPDWVAASSKLPANLPQIRLEPILRRRAEELAPGRVRFNQELVSFTQDEAGVTAAIADRATGETYQVRCQYLVSADGGRTCAPALGIQFSGMRDVVRVVTFHISADLTAIAPDPDVLIRWIPLPHTGKAATMVPMGPDWGLGSQEWVVHLNYEMADTRALDDDTVINDLRHALGIPDLDLTVHLVSRWSIEGVMAETFRSGRVLLAGDAGHRHPPTGGLGLNSAIQDAHNLAWKLAYVLRGQAGDALLDSYDAERRPVTANNVQRSLENALNHLVVADKLGLSADKTAAENWAAIRRLWSTDPADQEFRVDVLRHIHAQSMEFNELNVEYGYQYTSAAVLGDGTSQTPNPDPIRIYQSSTRPGSPLPHAWLCDIDGNRIAVMDLVKPGRFLLLAGEEGHDWCRAAAKVAAAKDFPIDAVCVGHIAGELYDPRSTWTRLRGHDASGAILIRPDRFVAWRAPALTDDPAAALSDTIDRVLAAPARG